MLSYTFLLLAVAITTSIAAVDPDPEKPESPFQKAIKKIGSGLDTANQATFNIAKPADTTRFFEALQPTTESIYELRKEIPTLLESERQEAEPALEALRANAQRIESNVLNKQEVIGQDPELPGKVNKAMSTLKKELEAFILAIVDQLFSFQEAINIISSGLNTTSQAAINIAQPADAAPFLEALRSTIQSIDELTNRVPTSLEIEYQGAEPALEVLRDNAQDMMGNALNRQEVISQDSELLGEVNAAMSTLEYGFEGFMLAIVDNLPQEAKAQASADLTVITVSFSHWRSS